MWLSDNCLSDDAKNFVLQNCYEEADKYGCESEVTPFSWKSYKKYPFFNDCEYEIYFPKKGAHKTQLTHKPFFKLNKDVNNDDYDLGKRRQSTSLGCFASKEKLIIEDNMNDEEKEYIVNSWTNFKYLDLTGDVITSLTTSLNKLLRFLIDAEVSDNEVKQMQLCSFNSVNSLFDKINNSNKIKDPELFESLKKSIKSFCCVVGSIGNRMPIPEFCNKHWGNDNYFHKINKLYIFHKIISIIKTNVYCAPDWKAMLSNNKSLENNIVDFYKNQLINNIDLINQSIPSYRKTKYENIWFYFFDTNEYKQFSDFIDDFCLQDYFKNNNYKNIVSPCKKMDDSNPGFPSKEASIEDWRDWRDWFNCNTCLILKRGARIYIEGCGEKDNEKKNKARKELAWKLIEKEFNLGTWYQNEGEELGLEVLV